MTVSVPREKARRRRLVFLNRRVWLLIAATFGVVGIIYMGQVSQAALIGARVNEKQDRLARLVRENVQLEADIAFLLAPDRIESRAKTLGLHMPRQEQIKYLVVKDYPLPQTNTTAPGVAATPAPGPDGWLQGLLQMFINSGVRSTVNPRP